MDMDILVLGVIIKFAPPTIAPEQDPDRMASTAWWTASAVAEQAVFTVMLGPSKSYSNATRFARAKSDLPSMRYGW
jgi:hypothetical protein